MIPLNFTSIYRQSKIELGQIYTFRKINFHATKCAFALVIDEIEILRKHEEKKLMKQMSSSSLCCFTCIDKIYDFESFQN